jgi:hypothetical protein
VSGGLVIVSFSRIRKTNLFHSHSSENDFLSISVAEPHHFYAAPAAPVPAPVPTLLI